MAVVESLKPMRCVKTAWQEHQAEVWRFLRQRLGNEQEADDLLQDLYLKALSQGNRFCDIGNPRAWLFSVARNALIDRYRTTKDHVPLPDDLEAETEPERRTVDDLSQCLPRVLSELSESDRQVLLMCDLEGISQKDYATSAGISLSAAKSRLQRARLRLQSHLVSACQVVFDEDGEICSFVPRPPPE